MPWLVSSLLPAERFIVLPNELLLRTNPTLLDLGIGLAAGAAGAYATVRTKVGSILAGVAIAVALVPPLAAIGILLQRGEGQLAAHAAAAAHEHHDDHPLRGGRLPGDGLHTQGTRDRLRQRIGPGPRPHSGRGALADPLALASLIWSRESEQSSPEAQVKQSIGVREVQVQDIEVDQADRCRIAIDLTGSEPPPPAQPLASILAHKLNHPVTLSVRYTPRIE